jgi:hypothetical protein
MVDRGTGELFRWVGQLREFAATRTAETPPAMDKVFSALDAAVARRDAEAQRLYEEGRARSRAIDADLQRQIVSAEDRATASKLRVDRSQIIRYAEFPFDRSVRKILAGLAQ